MKIKWFGHSCFHIIGEEGTKVLTDPYDESLNYASPEVEADFVLVSHDHFDHNNFQVARGSPSVVEEPGGGEEISLEVLSTYHDKSEGKDRGENNIYKFRLDGFSMAHFGDLGHELNEDQLQKLSDVEIAFIPTGGYYTIGPQEAAGIVKSMEDLKAVIPMHFKTEMLPSDDFPLAKVEDFNRNFGEVREIGGSEYSFSRLPDSLEVWVFDYVEG